MKVYLIKKSAEKYMQYLTSVDGTSFWNTGSSTGFVHSATNGTENVPKH